MAVYERFITEQPVSEKAAVIFVVNTYVLEMIRTFIFHTYLLRFVERCNEQSPDSYQASIARKMLPLVEPTTAQCYKTALAKLVSAPCLSRMRQSLTWA